MPFFRDLFGLGDSTSSVVDRLLNPLPHEKLREFVVSDHELPYRKFYFRFEDKYREEREFVLIYWRFGTDLEYVRTQYRRPKHEQQFHTTDDDGPWSSSIRFLKEYSAKHSNAPQSVSHFVSSVTSSHISYQPSSNSIVDPGATFTAAAVQLGRANKLRSSASSAWHTVNAGLAKSFNIHSKVPATLQIQLSYQRFLNGKRGCQLLFSVQPFLEVLPSTGWLYSQDENSYDDDDDDEGGTGLVDAPFDLVMAAGSSPSLASVFRVSASVSGREPDTIVLYSDEPDHIAALVTVIASAQPLAFGMRDRLSGNFDLAVSLENDPGFSDLHRVIWRSV